MRLPGQGRVACRGCDRQRQSCRKPGGRRAQILAERIGIGGGDRHVRRERVAVLHRLAAALAERVAHNRQRLDREVGVRKVEEDVPDRLDLDPRLRRADVGQRHCLGAVVRRARRQDVGIRIAPIRRQRDLHVSRANRRDVGVRHVPGDRLGRATLVGDRRVRRCDEERARTCRRSSSVVSPLFVAALAVTGGEAEVERERAGIDAREADIVGRREELREALGHALRHRRRDRPGRARARIGVRVVVQDLLDVREHARRIGGEVVLARRVVLERVAQADLPGLREHREQRPVRLGVVEQRRARPCRRGRSAPSE